VLAGKYDLQHDLAPLLQRLAVTTDEDEQDDLVNLPVIDEAVAISQAEPERSVRFHGPRLRRRLGLRHSFARESAAGTIDLLIARGGANVKWKDGNGNTLLMFAIDCSPAVVAKPLDAGVSLDAVNATKFSALQMAFAKGEWDVAALLVERATKK
jgi:hypothetical protein